MSHWVKVCTTVNIVGDKHADKSSIPGGTQIVLSKRVKVRKPIKLAKEPGNFISACGKAGIQPTRRQLSKWNRKRGLAYKAS